MLHIYKMIFILTL